MITVSARGARLPSGDMVDPTPYQILAGKKFSLKDLEAINGNDMVRCPTCGIQFNPSVNPTCPGTLLVQRDEKGRTVKDTRGKPQMVCSDGLSFLN